MSVDLPNVMTALVLTTVIAMISWIGLRSPQRFIFFVAICALTILAAGVLLRAFLI